MNLIDAKVLVTGGSSGIGLETARLLVEAGAGVVICGRDEGRLQAAAKEVGAVPVRADVSLEADVVALVEATVERLGGYNVLVNNAAYGYGAPLVDIDLERFNALIATNLTGAMLVARESARRFVAQEYGHIVNVASSSGVRGSANSTPYVATKFALRGMTECWRAELRPHNVRVMLVNPSEVQTPFAVNAGRQARPHSDRKLEGADIAHAIKAMLEMDDRGFIPELSVWATNPD